MADSTPNLGLTLPEEGDETVIREDLNENMTKIDAAMTARLIVAGIAPSLAAGIPYLWVETGLGGGDDMTFWIEDGT